MRDECVVHADETRHFRGTQVYWLWALVSEHPRYVLTHHSRGMAAAELLIGASKVIVVTDDDSGYNRLDPTS